MNSFSSGDIKRIALDALLNQYSEQLFLSGIHTGTPELVIHLETNSAYYLVPVYNDSGLCGIVQISKQNLRPESSALIKDAEAVFLISGEDALEAAKKIFPDRTALTRPFLGWKPCRESYSSMFPFWVIKYREGDVYVTQNRDVFEKLTSGYGGGEPQNAQSI